MPVIRNRAVRLLIVGLAFSCGCRNGSTDCEPSAPRNALRLCSFVNESPDAAAGKTFDGNHHLVTFDARAFCLKKTATFDAPSDNQTYLVITVRDDYVDQVRKWSEAHDGKQIAIAVEDDVIATTTLHGPLVRQFIVLCNGGSPAAVEAKDRLIALSLSQ